MSDETSETSTTATVRAQRDRFLAFAFAAANVLLEITSEGQVVYCAGTTEQMFRRKPETMRGLNIVDLVPAEDSIVVGELLRRLASVGKVEGMYLRFLTGDGGVAQGVVSGLALPDSGGNFHVTVTRARGGQSGGRDASAKREALSKKDFVEIAKQRIDEGKQFGDNYNMTLVDLDQTRKELGSKVEPENVAKFLANVEGFLQAWSVGGNSVGKLGDNKFGIIHDASIATPSIEERIGEIASGFDPEGNAPQISASTLEMDTSTLTVEDISKALVYTVNRFVQDGGENFAVKSLSDGYQVALNETLSKVNAFRSTILSNDFCFVYQPIVSLTDYKVHHYEALARVKQDGHYILPSKFISFAEDLGVITELDHLACQKAISILRTGINGKKDFSIAVNLSGRSIVNTSFVTGLLRMLVESRDILPSLLFEVTESAEIKNLEEANGVLQKIRSFGCKICMDDFGAGAAAFSYLKALQLDYIKIDGAYILDAFNTRHGRPFLKAIANLCSDLKMEAIGEMIEDERAVRLLRELKVDFGQGYYFGRPTVEPQEVKVAPLSSSAPASATPAKRSNASR